MTRPTFIRQPGPSAEPRFVAVECRCERITMELRSGHNLLSELHRGFGTQGFAGGVANVGGLSLSPFAYVMPALSTTGENAAFYSETFRPRGITHLKTAAVTIGERDGAPFFHCHGTWLEADDKRSGGHILPDETVLAETIEIEALALDGALFVARHDPETNFKLFAPEAIAIRSPDRGRRAVASRLKPNQDFLSTLEAIADQFGIKRARICGGVGSLIGAAFDDGALVDNFATEVLITKGAIARDGAGAARGSAEIAMVDYTHALAAGALKRTDNPVLMTFELVLEIDEVPT